jgi:hypothetical protein
MNKTVSVVITVICLSTSAFAQTAYTIVDTGQTKYYDNTREIRSPKAGEAFFGQDANYGGNQPSYKNNGDGTISDLNTGLMWTQNPGGKKTYRQAAAGASKGKVGGFTDWRLPSVKELYSLILFSGTDPDPQSTNTSRLVPFIDVGYFKFQYGNPENGDRVIDSQFATSTIYRGTTMGGNKTMFGVNFADGRIKGYPTGMIHGREKTYSPCMFAATQNTGKIFFATTATAPSPTAPPVLCG